MKKLIITILILVAIFLIGIAGRFLLAEKPTGDQTNTNNTSLEYRNTQYGFSFLLPASWKGYSVVVEYWNGFMTEQDQPSDQILSGPKFLIRHPLWTAEKPRQDIPVMIFTWVQWNLVTQEKMSVGAAPIGPSELGRNANYVFALPSRYNYAFPEGFEEVNRIIQSKSFLAL